MMTDTSLIVKLPTCGRRTWITTPDEKWFVCKPPSKLPDLPAAELLKIPGLFRTREVTCEDCLACKDQELEVVRPKTLESDEQHPIDRAPDNTDPPQLAPQRPPHIGDDGTITYQHEGWEPPPVPRGYRRKSDNLKSRDAWVLVRETPLCKRVVLHRVEKAACNCISVLHVCTYRGKAENISVTKCDSCPHYKARND